MLENWWPFVEVERHLTRLREQLEQADLDRTVGSELREVDQVLRLKRGCRR